MKLLIRCDSSNTIGHGHVVRCVNLAILLSKSGHEVIFLTKNLEGNISQLIARNNFEVIFLDSKDQAVDDVDVFNSVSHIIKSKKPNLIVVDSYQLGANWEKNVKLHGSVVMAIDDIFRKHEADIILDQNYGSAGKYLLNGKQLGLFGPTHALLPQQFLQARPLSWEALKIVRKVVLFFGGSDSCRQSERFIGIADKLGSEIEYDLVMGQNAVGISQVKELMNQCKSKINLHIQTDKMLDLLSNSQLFIGASGSVTWERAYLGIPALCISVASNQEPIGQGLADLSSHEYLGRHSDITDQQIVKSVTSLMTNAQRRKELHENSLSLKVSSALSGLEVKLTHFINTCERQAL
jgi:UDP-2,4-diacetamido-2,4,6-trideoxy-beta-L-altropyranose hydrolase